MSLSKLNRDCLLSLLEAASLKDQLYLRLVCTDWCVHLEGCLARRRQLALIPLHSGLYTSDTLAQCRQRGAVYRQYYGEAFTGTVFALGGESLLVPTTTLRHTGGEGECRNPSLPALKRLFPRLRKVLLLPGYTREAFSCSDAIPGLLRLWEDSLVTVGLNFTPTYEVEWSSLFTVLASLRRLRHLHIEELTRYSIVSEERSQQQVNAPRPLVALVLQRLVTFSTHSHLHDYLAHLRGGTCRHLYLSRVNCMSTWPVLPSVRVLRLMNRDSSRIFRQTLELVDSQLRRCLPSLERLLIERNTESCLIWWQKKSQGPHYYEDEAPFEGACTRWQEKVAVPISWLPTGRLATPDKSWNRQGLEGNSDATLRSWFTVYLIEM